MYANNPNSYGSLEKAKKILAAGNGARDELLDCLARIEKRLQGTPDFNVREDLTGPLADLLFTPGELLTREIAGGLKFNFRYSSKIARDFMMARQKPLDHVWEPQTTRALVELARGARNVIVGGAYFGDHAILIARAMGKDGTCHCFELSSDNLEMLKSNIEANAITNIKVNQRALWSEDGKHIVLAGEDSHASPQLAEAVGGSERFLSQSIDAYVKQQRLGQVDVIMLDIEGGEYEALIGSKAMLAEPADRAPVLICEIHGAYVDWSEGLAATPLCKLMIDNGYEVFAIRDYQGNDSNAGHIVELVDIDSAVISGPRHGFNLLASKSRKRLNPKVFSFVSNVSPKLLYHRDQKIHGPLSKGA